MKKIALLLGIVSLLAAVGCEMHPPRTDEHGEHGDKASGATQAPATPQIGGASTNPPQFFPKSQQP